MKAVLVLAIWGVVIPHLLFLKYLLNAVACEISWLSFLCDDEFSQEVTIFMMIAPLLLVDRMHYFAYTSTLGIGALIFNLLAILWSAEK